MRSGPKNVDLELPRGGLRRKRFQHAEERGPGVVDEHVYRTGSEDLSRCPVDRGLIGDLEIDHADALPLELGGGLGVLAAGVANGCENAPAGRGKALGGVAAEPGTGPGDDDGLWLV